MITETAINQALFIFTTSVPICLFHSYDGRVLFSNHAVVLSACAFQLSPVLWERKLERQRYFGAFGQRRQREDNKVGFVIAHYMTYLQYNRVKLKHQAKSSLKNDRLNLKQFV